MIGFSSALPMRQEESSGGLNISTSDWVFLLAIVLVVMLFLGPGLWSNHDEMPITYFWRWLRKKKNPGPEDPQQRYSEDRLS